MLDEWDGSMVRLTGDDDHPDARTPSSASGMVIILSRPVQVGLAVVLFGLSAWLTVATVSYFGSRSLLVDRADYIGELEDAYEQMVAETESSTEVLLDQVRTLEDDTSAHREALSQLREVQSALQSQLSSREDQLRSVLGQRDRARVMLMEIEAGFSLTSDRLRQALEEKLALGNTVAILETQVTEVTEQRDTVRRAERALRWQVARLESQLESADQDRAVAQLWFKDWVAGNVASLQDLFVDTGVDLETLIARAAANETGAGGPLQGVDAMNGLAAAPGGDPITAQIRRLSALQRLASAMPLASPLDHFHVTSHFGKRKDPFTKRWAFHGGLDLGAAPGSKILATAPGRVVHAGIGGPYGNMVEIDHGMGVTTRYGHLKSVSVEMMQEVDFRQEIGVIGSTGRSTARHLHYEVRIDGKGYDPAKFLEAGRYLVDLLNFAQASEPPAEVSTVTPMPKPKS